jgi:hypothetical protein
MRNAGLCLIVMVSATATAYAESRDPFSLLDSKKFAQCTAIETVRSTVTTPVSGQAVAGCETGGGGVKSCTVGVGPNQADYVLDTTIDRNGAWICTKLAGDNPCAFVQAGPIIFNSETSASRTFTTNSDRVLVAQAIPQLKVTATYSDNPQTPKTLYTDTKFSLAIRKSTYSSRLECTLTTGDQLIYPIIDGKDLSDKIKFVSENTDDAVLKIITYQVTH